MLMEQKTFSRSGLAVFSRNPLTLGRGGSQKVMMLYRDKLLFLT